MVNKDVYINGYQLQHNLKK